MKISPYSPKKPIILGDLGEEPKTRNLPKLTEQEIFDMQPESTKELMRMDPSDEYVARCNWLADRDFKRSLSVEEVVLYEEHRRSNAKFSEGFYKADKTSVIRGDNFNGDYQGTSTSQESRDRASQAFRFTPPATVSEAEIRQKAVNLTEYKSELKHEWRPLKWYQALWHKLRGGVIKSQEELKGSWRDRD